eukprot:s2560_g3.t1
MKLQTEQYKTRLHVLQPAGKPAQNVLGAFFRDALKGFVEVWQGVICQLWKGAAVQNITRSAGSSSTAFAWRAVCLERHGSSPSKCFCLSGCLPAQLAARTVCDIIEPCRVFYR